MSDVQLNNCQAFHEEYVTVRSVPTHVVTCGMRLEEKLPKIDLPPYLILCIPGNPGAIEFYVEFLTSLYESLHRTIPVWGVSYAGHVLPPPGYDTPKLKGNENLYSLEGQIQHKMAFITNFVPPECNLILIGHSNGCYMILELLKRLPRLKITRCFFIFPTIERLATLPAGKLMWPIFTWLRIPILIFIQFINYLGPSIKSRLVEWYLQSWNVPPCLVTAGYKLFHPDCANASLFLADDVFKNVDILDLENIRRNLFRLTFYYGTKDHWCPVSHYHDMKRAFPEGDFRLCKNEFEHSFVMEASVEMASLVSSWIREEILEKQLI